MRDYWRYQLNPRLIWLCIGWRLALWALGAAVLFTAVLLAWESGWLSSSEGHAALWPTHAKGSRHGLLGTIVRDAVLLVLAWVSFASWGRMIAVAWRDGVAARKGLWASHDAEDRGSRLLLAARLLHGNVYVGDVAQWRVVERSLIGEGRSSLKGELRLAIDVLILDAMRWRRGELVDLFDEPSVLAGTAWRGLFAGDFERVKWLSMRVRLLSPGSIAVDSTLAHAELLSGNVAAADLIYRRHVGCVVDRGAMRRWEEVVLDDLARLQRAGCGHPEMERIAAEMRAALAV